MFKTIGRIIRESLTDSQTNRYSHAKVVAMLVAIAATVFMWKLVLLGGMSIDYFIAYLAYGTGHQSINKFLDNRPGGRNNPNKDDDSDTPQKPAAKPPKV